MLQERAAGNIHLMLGTPLQTGRFLLRWKNALVNRARLLDKTGPVEFPLRDKPYNFAHLLTTSGNYEEIFRQRSPAFANDRRHP